MADSSSTSSFKAVDGETWRGGMPVAAGIAVLCIVMFELLFVQLNLTRFLDGIESAMHAKREVLSDPLVKDDVAVFGDSKMFSVDPMEISRCFGGNQRVTNYAWAFMGVESYDAVLRRYLAVKPAPKTIIVNARSELVACPEWLNSMNGTPSHRVRAYTLLPFLEIVECAILDRNWSLIWDRLTYAFVPPSAAHKKYVWVALRHMLSGRGWPKRGNDDERMARQFREEGAFLMYREWKVTLAEALAAEKVIGPYDVYQNSRQIASFDRFLERAGKSGIKVVMIGVPMAPPLQQRFETLGANQRYLALINQWESKYPHFNAVQPLLYELPLENFGDAGHVNAMGNVLFREAYRKGLTAHLEASPLK